MDSSSNCNWLSERIFIFLYCLAMYRSSMAFLFDDIFLVVGRRISLFRCPLVSLAFFRISSFTWSLSSAWNSRSLEVTTKLSCDWRISLYLSKFRGIASNFHSLASLKSPSSKIHKMLLKCSFNKNARYLLTRWICGADPKGQVGHAVIVHFENGRIYRDLKILSADPERLVENRIFAMDLEWSAVLRHWNFRLGLLGIDGSDWFHAIIGMSMVQSEGNVISGNFELNKFVNLDRDGPLLVLVVFVCKIIGLFGFFQRIRLKLTYPRKRGWIPQNP